MRDAPEPSEHGPQHTGCPTCDPQGGTAPAGRHVPAVVRVQARGEEFKIVQVDGNLFVCSKANGNCCCGREEKGRMPFDNALWSDEWERRRIRSRVHLTFSGCLGPCAVGNNAMLQLFGRSIWFKDLNDPTLAAQVFDYIEAMLGAKAVLPVPTPLAGHVYQRYIAAPDGGAVLDFGAPALGGDGLEGLDPVCLMSVDIATAQYTAEHLGRIYGFCAKSCLTKFQADPGQYLTDTDSSSMS